MNAEMLEALQEVAADRGISVDTLFAALADVLPKVTTCYIPRTSSEGWASPWLSGCPAITMPPRSPRVDGCKPAFQNACGSA